jgi:response regulator RpfG family c-di-GMP phosphodiesterase
MYTAEHPAHSRPDAPLDVIVLVAPSRSTSGDQFLHTIAELKSAGRAAILVVFPHLADTQTLSEASAAGADLCVVAPTSDELFPSIERARSVHRTTSRTGTGSTRDRNCRRGDELLDTLWRKRSQTALTPIF